MIGLAIKGVAGSWWFHFERFISPFSKRNIPKACSALIPEFSGFELVTESIT
jgi:hypothetical protein